MFIVGIVVMSTGEPPSLKFSVILFQVLKFVGEVKRNHDAGLSGLHGKSPNRRVFMTDLQNVVTRTRKVRLLSKERFGERIVSEQITRNWNESVIH